MENGIKLLIILDVNTAFLSDCNGTLTHNHLVQKDTLNYLANLVKW